MKTVGSADKNKSILREDRQIGSIAAVFDDLKDYLSDSDLSLDYKIALRRRKNRAAAKKFEFSDKNKFECSNKENYLPGRPSIEYSGESSSKTKNSGLCYKTLCKAMINTPLSELARFLNENIIKKDLKAFF